MIRTIRSDSGYGRGRRRMLFTSVNIAVVAPMPSASVIVATAVNAGIRRKVRSAYWKSLQRSPPQCGGNRLSMPVPERRLGAETRAARTGEAVELRATVVVRHAPLASDPAAALQAVERGIERALFEEEKRRRGALDPLTD